MTAVMRVFSLAFHNCHVKVKPENMVYPHDGQGHPAKNDDRRRSISWGRSRTLNPPRSRYSHDHDSHHHSRGSNYHGSDTHHNEEEEEVKAGTTKKEQDKEELTC